MLVAITIVSKVDIRNFNDLKFLSVHYGFNKFKKK
jgi:hypothetical protein